MAPAGLWSSSGTAATTLMTALINDICWAPGAQPELALLARVLFAGT